MDQSRPILTQNLSFQSAPRVKFALDSNQMQDNNNNGNGQKPHVTPLKTNGVNSLQRSKSMSSADALARGIAGLGLGIGHDPTDIGTFKPEIQAVIDQALIDPNQLNARSLMELANQIMQRAVDGRRYVLCATNSICSEENKLVLMLMICSLIQIRFADITLLHFDHCKRAERNVFGGDAEHMPSMVSGEGQSAGTTAEYKEFIASSVHRFHGISHRNVLPIEAAPIAVANEMRRCIAANGFTHTSVQMLRGLCETTGSVIVGGKTLDSRLLFFCFSLHLFIQFADRMSIFRIDMHWT